VQSGDRTSRDRETHSAIPGKTNPESRWSKVNLGECPLAPQTLTFRLPEYRTPILCEHATWTPLRLRGPTLPRPLRDFADREILGSESFAVESPTTESPTLWIHTTCPSRNRWSRSNRGISLRDFNVHGIIALPNSDSPICGGQGFLLLSEG
jgi:hypothetical protein